MRNKKQTTEFYKNKLREKYDSTVALSSGNPKNKNSKYCRLQNDSVN